MRRRLALALTALATVAIALAVTGSGAMAFDPGPLGAQPDPVQFNTQAVGVTTPARTVTFSDDSGTVPILIQNVTASSDYNVGNDNCSGADAEPERHLHRHRHVHAGLGRER